MELLNLKDAVVDVPLQLRKIRRCADLSSIGTFCQRTLTRPFCPFYSDTSVGDDGVGSS